MNYYKSLLYSVLFFTVFTMSCKNENITELKWYDIAEIQTLNDRSPKKTIVLVYDPTCGKCRELRESAFAHSSLNAFLQENYRITDLNIYERREINLANGTYGMMANMVGNPFHTLAPTLTQESTQEHVTTPSLVFLDEKLSIIVPIKKAISAKELELLSAYIASDSYLTSKTIDQFKKDYTYKYVL